MRWWIGLSASFFISLIWVSNAQRRLYTRPRTSISYVREYENLNIQPKPITNRMTFEEMILANGYIVDKSLLIEAVLSSPLSINIIIYPPNWGKTFNMKMLKTYLETEIDDQGNELNFTETRAYKLFYDGLIVTPNATYHLNPKLRITERDGTMQESLARYTVIYVDFSKIGDFKNYKSFLKSFAAMIKEIILEHSFCFNILNKKLSITSEIISRTYLKTFTVLRDGNGENCVSELMNSVASLAAFFKKYLGLQTYVLIDDYDIIHNYVFLQAKNFAKEDERLIIEFVSSFFTLSLESISDLAGAILTGFMRIELDVFEKGINFIGVLGNSDAEINLYYGFSELDVNTLVKRYQPAYEVRMKDIKYLYNGYTIRHAINETYHFYNTISIQTFLQSSKFCSHWIDTNIQDQMMYYFTIRDFRSMIIECIKDNSKPIALHNMEEEIKMKDLRRMREFVTQCQENRIFLNPNFQHETDTCYKHFYFYGYLTTLKMIDRDDKKEMILKIPNEEIRISLKNTFFRFLKQQLNTDTDVIENFSNDLLKFISNSNYSAIEFQTKFSNLLQTIKPLGNLTTFSPKEGNRILVRNEAIVHHLLTAAILFIDSTKTNEFYVRLPFSPERPDFIFVWSETVALVEIKYQDPDASSALKQCKEYTEQIISEVVSKNEFSSKKLCYSFQYIAINMRSDDIVDVLTATNTTIPCS